MDTITWFSDWSLNSELSGEVVHSHKLLFILWLIRLALIYFFTCSLIHSFSHQLIHSLTPLGNVSWSLLLGSTVRDRETNETYFHLQELIWWVQFSSVTQSCLTLCNPVDCSIRGLPVHHQLLEFAQTHVHWVSDAIQPSQPLSSPSPLAFNLTQPKGLFQWIRS